MQDSYLTYFLTELAGTTAMIFTRTCDNTRRLALMLRNLGFDALPIHGQMSQPKRLGALNKFKGVDLRILLNNKKPTLMTCRLFRFQKALQFADAAQLKLWCSALS